MRNGIVRAYTLGIITGSMVTAGLALLTSPEAKAETGGGTIASYTIPVCATLDRYPSFDGIKGIAAAIAEDGYTYSEAGEIIVGAVVNMCPEFAPLLRRFADTYAPKTSTA